MNLLQRTGPTAAPVVNRGAVIDRLIGDFFAERLRGASYSLGGGRLPSDEQIAIIAQQCARIFLKDEAEVEAAAARLLS